MFDPGLGGGPNEHLGHGPPRLDVRWILAVEHGAGEDSKVGAVGARALPRVQEEGLEVRPFEGGHLGQDPRGESIEDGFAEGLFGAEVPMYEPVVDASASGDVAHGDAADPALGEERGGRVDQCCANLFPTPWAVLVAAFAQPVASRALHGSRWIFSWRRMSPSSTCSGRGGHPGM